MIPSHKIISVFMLNGTPEKGVGSQRRGREREKEWQINGVSNGALVGNGDASWQWPLVKSNT
jgi:hypothetical protein